MWIRVSAVLIGIAAVTACSESSLVTDPVLPSTPGSVQGHSPWVHDPLVLVGGTPVVDPVSRGTGERVLFRIHVAAPRGLSTVRRVVMEYAQPGPNRGGGSMMGGFRGWVLCLDDGTQGDDVPGDGVYHYMDPNDQIGCHGLSAPHGEYRYSFWAEDENGRRSNTASIVLSRE